LEQRIARERDPGLPRRVPRDRVKVLWASRDARKDLDTAVDTFSATLETIKHEPRRFQAKHEDDQNGGESVTGGAAND
ncbi:MAG: hypothetical protein K8F25_07615, partial [Fimbriimonadaceae bacterium]|nr:hypothetical protein [Alphaproteobacteria bacterium]